MKTLLTTEVLVGKAVVAYLKVHRVLNTTAGLSASTIEDLADAVNVLSDIIPEQYVVHTPSPLPAKDDNENLPTD